MSSLLKQLNLHQLPSNPFLFCAVHILPLLLYWFRLVLNSSFIVARSGVPRVVFQECSKQSYIREAYRIEGHCLMEDYFKHATKLGEVMKSAK